MTIISLFLVMHLVLCTPRLLNILLLPHVLVREALDLLPLMFSHLQDFLTPLIMRLGQRYREFI